MRPFRLAASTLAIAAQIARPTDAVSQQPTPPPTPTALTAATLMRQVEVRRTTYGVPHIKAENLAAAGYAEAYVQSEDYGARVALSLLRARGEMARWFGRDSMNQDFNNRLAWARAVETYPCSTKRLATCMTVLPRARTATSSSTQMSFLPGLRRTSPDMTSSRKTSS
jgi:acyl-homoserine lactone acylase PvdQ